MQDFSKAKKKSEIVLKTIIFQFLSSHTDCLKRLSLHHCDDLLHLPQAPESLHSADAPLRPLHDVRLHPAEHQPADLSRKVFS